MEQSHKPEAEQKKVIIDLAVPEDAEEIVRIMKDTWRAVYVSPENGVNREEIDKIAGSFTVGYTARELDLNKENDSKIFILAKDQNGVIMGFLQGIKKPEYNELRSIYLDVNDIGSGTGGRLMEYFLSWADQRKPCQLEVASYNERAKGFYEHYGFQSSNEIIDKSRGIIPLTRMIRPPQNIT
jgi:ribosomal protein S18 acetylase RimI-like enzyme